MVGNYFTASGSVGIVRVNLEGDITPFSFVWAEGGTENGGAASHRLDLKLPPTAVAGIWGGESLLTGWILNFPPTAVGGIGQR